MKVIESKHSKNKYHVVFFGDKTHKVLPQNKVLSFI